MPAHVATPTKDCGWVLIEDGFTLAREREVEVADPPSKWIFRPDYPVTSELQTIEDHCEHSQLRSALSIRRNPEPPFY